jgi:DNA modification methylase
MFNYQSDLISIQEASSWAATLIGKNITTSNISYLVQYGRIKKFGRNGSTLVSRNELYSYYSKQLEKEKEWKETLGRDINWALSFDQYKEAETTKHVHRLHPYKGKLIPQLVEYFLDEHTDEFKKHSYFKKGDIVYDPFAGSGTTLVQANELGIHAVGVDISPFNALISNSKISQPNLFLLSNSIRKITDSLLNHLQDNHTLEFEKELSEKLSHFNNSFFPVPEYKVKVKNKEIDEKEYGSDKEKEFLPIFHELSKKYGIVTVDDKPKTFLEKWYFKHTLIEINFVFDLIKKIEDIQIKKMLSIILSRTIRSCRATTHADLATLISPVTTTYYCAKHGKVCKPLFSILKWWQTYSKDTISRLSSFAELRTHTNQLCLVGDSRSIDLISAIENKNDKFSDLIKEKRINGIFTSPPYVGLIDYHEQHAYAYDLFGFTRNDDSEIGPMFRGQGKQAQADYIKGISEVLINSKKYLAENYNVFLVANDKFNIYPKIATNCGMQIVNKFERPVLNRTEKDKSAYSETIFHLKKIV